MVELGRIFYEHNHHTWVMRAIRESKEHGKFHETANFLKDTGTFCRVSPDCQHSRNLEREVRKRHEANVPSFQGVSLLACRVNAFLTQGRQGASKGRNGVFAVSITSLEPPTHSLLQCGRFVFAASHCFFVTKPELLCFLMKLVLPPPVPF